MKELKQILLKAKKQVFSNLSGENLTRLKGDGMDLRDIKSYEWGDDIRRINWKATAKSDEILVNTYDEYKQLNISLIYLPTPTMSFGSLRFKSDVASEIFAYLLFSGVKNHDLVKSEIFEEKTYKPLKKLQEIDSIVSDVFYHEANKKIDYEKLSHFINKSYKRGHIIILVGDFLSPVDLSLINKKHQLYALVIRDRLEEKLEFSGDLALRDFYTNKSSEFFINEDIKQRYNNLINSHDRKLEEHFLKNKISYKKIYTDDEVYIKLKEVFK